MAGLAFLLPDPKENSLSVVISAQLPRDARNWQSIDTWNLSLYEKFLEHPTSSRVSIEPIERRGT